MFSWPLDVRVQGTSFERNGRAAEELTPAVASTDPGSRDLGEEPRVGGAGTSLQGALQGLEAEVSLMLVIRRSDRASCLRKEVPALILYPGPQLGRVGTRRSTQEVQRREYSQAEGLDRRTAGSGCGGARGGKGQRRGRGSSYEEVGWARGGGAAECDGGSQGGPSGAEARQGW